MGNSEARRLKRIRQKRPPGAIRQTLRDALVRIHKGICQSCGVLTNENDFEYVRTKDGLSLNKRLGPKHPTIQHIVPLIVKVSWELKDLTLYCHKCNNKESVLFSQLDTEQ